MEELKGLELATILCIGLLGFIVFVMIGCFAKKNNNVYFCICGMFSLMALSPINYNSPYTQWAYIEGNFVWNIIATVLVTVVMCVILLGILYVWMTISEHLKYERKAKQARMSVQEFKEWKERTLEKIVESIKAEGRTPQYEDLLNLYENEEKSLFSFR